MKNIRNFYLKIFIFFFFFFLVEYFPVYLNRHVFVMFKGLYRIKNLMIALEKKTFEHCAQRRLKSAWLFFVVRMEKFCVRGYPKCAQWRAWWNCANAPADPNLWWTHMFEGNCMLFWRRDPYLRERERERESIYFLPFKVYIKRLIFSFLWNDAILYWCEIVLLPLYFINCIKW